MPRERAIDYEQKTSLIKDAAAIHFATTGYPAAKLADIAKSCGVSKSMLYHYFPSKDDLLFSMIEEHLDAILDELQFVAHQKHTAVIEFRCFLQTLLMQSTSSRQRNIVAMSEAKYLPTKLLKRIKQKDLKVLILIQKCLGKLNPNLDESLYKPYALMLTGIINWTDTWFDDNGVLTREELVHHVSDLFLHGFLSKKT